MPTSRPGTELGRAHVQRDGDDIWMGGNTVTVVDGTIDLTDVSWADHQP